MLPVKNSQNSEFGFCSTAFRLLMILVSRALDLTEAWDLFSELIPNNYRLDFLYVTNSILQEPCCGLKVRVAQIKPNREEEKAG